MYPETCNIYVNLSAIEDRYLHHTPKRGKNMTDIDLTKPIQVYRNLNKPGCQFSVRQGGRVRCYVDEIVLRDARFKHATEKQLSANGEYLGM
jgi:hypothetical protein